MAAELAYMHASKVAKASGALRYLNRVGSSKVARLADSAPREVVDDIFSCALKKQTGNLGHFLVTSLPSIQVEFTRAQNARMKCGIIVATSRMGTLCMPLQSTEVSVTGPFSSFHIK